MHPLRDDGGRRPPPLGVGALLLVNVVGYAWGAGGDPAEAAAWLDRWGLVPRLFLASLERPPQATWLTPLTSMFLHGGPLHLAGNALFLWIFGRALEERLGWQRFLVFYLACGLAAALVHVAASPASYLPTIGASGAVSGLLGAFAVSDPAGRLRFRWLPVRVPAIAFLFVWIAWQLASGFADEGGVAGWAHLGGFVAGVALARSVFLRRPTRPRHGV